MKACIVGLLFLIAVLAVYATPTEKVPKVPMDVNSDEVKKLAKNALITINHQTNNAYLFTLTKIIEAWSVQQYCNCSELVLNIVSNPNCLKNKVKGECDKQPPKDARVQQAFVNITAMGTKPTYTFKIL